MTLNQKIMKNTIPSIRNKKKSNFRCSLIAFFISQVLMTSAYADDYFNPAALTIDGEEVADIAALSNFSVPGGQLPGVYYVTIKMNEQSVARKDVNFINVEGEKELFPVITKQELMDWGVKVEQIPSLAKLPDSDEIIDIGKYIEYANTKFILNKQQLNINIPQIYIDQRARGYVNPKDWNQGINAFTLNYNVSGSKTFVEHGDSTSSEYLNLRSGLNVGAWRLRNYSTYNHSSTGDSKWNSLQTYLERDIQPLKSQFSAGQISTDGEVIDGFSFRGVKIYSDESMLPSSQRGFAPVVRGFANGNATVTIRQNDAIIYQSYVAAGPFVIDDLYPTNYSGNLEVTVAEEDGSEHTFVVPFSAVAIMQREGHLKYSASAGKYYGGGTKKPVFGEVTAIYGLPWNMTVYGGALLSKNYQSGVTGLGFDLMGLGALSTDMTYARTKFEDSPDNLVKTGQSYRIQYSKSMIKTGTTLTLAAYRYSTEGFYDFSEANGDSAYDNMLNGIRNNKKARLQASINQSFGDYGSFYLTAYQQNYWNMDGKESSFGGGYSFNVWGMSTSISYYYSKMPNDDKKYRQLSLSVSIPLGDLLTKNNYLSSSFSSSLDGSSSASVSLSGSALEDGSLSYSISQSRSHTHASGTNSNSGSTSIGYNGDIARFNVGYGYSKDSQRINYGINGGAIISSYGLALAPSVGDTTALIVAPGAVGASVGTSTVGRFGTAVKSYVTPYANNRISLNVNDLASNAEIMNNDVNVIPTKGAVVVAKFDTRVGYRALIQLIRSDEKQIPFASVITMEDQGDIGIVGEGSEAYVSGLPETGEFKVSWGAKPDQTCIAHYTLPVASQEEDIVLRTQAICQEPEQKQMLQAEPDQPQLKSFKLVHQSNDGVQ